MTNYATMHFIMELRWYAMVYVDKSADLIIGNAVGFAIRNLRWKCIAFNCVFNSFSMQLGKYKNAGGSV